MPLSGIQKGQLFKAQGATRETRHQATMPGIRLGGLMSQLKFQQDDLAGQERVHEYVRKTALRDAGLGINESLDAPDSDDDRNIRPVYHGTREEQLEAQIVMLEKVGERTAAAEKKGWGITGPILAVLAIFIAAQRNFKAYK